MARRGRSAPLAGAGARHRRPGGRSLDPPCASSSHPTSRGHAVRQGAAATATLRAAPQRLFYNPLPGGTLAGYQADTGLDIASSPGPVFALAAGTLDYSEPGHTLWQGPRDTANCVRFALDQPIAWKGRSITHVYYAHLSGLAYTQREGESPRRHIDAGEFLGVSGIANGSPHLHIGLLLDGEVEQNWGTFLRADEIRAVLGGLRNGARLPRLPAFALGSEAR